MIDLSTEFKNEMFNDNRNFLPFVDITLKDGTVLNLTREDIWQNSFSIEDATSSWGKFTIGAAVTAKLKITLNNIYDDFSEYDFAGARVIAYVGLQLSKSLEKVRVGTFTVDNPSYDGSTISLSCLDDMTKVDKPYKESTLIYPATLGQILQDVCTCCGISMVSANFPNKDYLVQNRPKDDAITFGDILVMVAQLAGCWAKMDVHGRLKVDWYKMSVFEKNKDYDGGAFGTATIPYSDGDTVDGGNFTNYLSGDTVDGGTFAGQAQYHHIYSTKSLSVSTDDVVITGVRVTEEFEETEQDKKDTFFIGKEGYLVEIAGNPLIQKGQAQVVAKYLYERVGGMRFRPLDVECLANPAIEAGDIAYVTDRKQNTYQTFISTRVFKLGGGENITCDAETPLKNSQKKFSDLTKAIVKAREETKKRLSAYDLAVQQLTNLMTQSFGVFKSEEVLEDGSVIYYMHNKPERANSSTIWKMTADAFAVSTDGGKTWNAGIDSSGNIVANVLSVIGLNADWIRAGIIKDKKDKSYWNLDSGLLHINGSLTQETASGVKSIDVENNQVRFYAWNDNGNYVGSMGAVKRTESDRVGVNVWCDDGDFLSLGCKDAVSEEIVPVITIDSNTHKDATPWIRNTANGTLFPNNPLGGAIVENGLIKKFNIHSVLNDTLSVITGLSWSNGNITSVTRANVNIRDGLVVSWTSETTNY